MSLIQSLAIIALLVLLVLLVHLLLTRTEFAVILRQCVGWSHNPYRIQTPLFDNDEAKPIFERIPTEVLTLKTEDAMGEEGASFSHNRFMVKNEEAESSDNDEGILGSSMNNQDQRLVRAQSTDSLDSTGSMLNERINDECPQLQIRIAYDRQNQLLQLDVVQLCDGPSITGQVWIVVFLLPHPKPLWRTELRPASFLPVQFNQSYRQCVRHGDLSKIALMCQLYSENGIVSLLGQCRMRLKDLDLSQGNAYWLTMSSPALQDFSQVQNAGEVLLSLSYAQDRLSVIISRIRHLPETVKSALIRVYLVQGGGGKVLKKKTSTKTIENRGSFFNESLFMSLNRGKFEKAHLRLSVVSIDGDRRSSIGHVTIGNRRSGKELGHWQRLRQECPVSMWHTISPKQQ